MNYLLAFDDVGMYRFLPYIMALLIAVPLLAVFWLVDHLEQRRTLEESRREVLHEVSTVRAKLEAALNAKLFLTSGLVAYVSNHPEIDDAEFHALAAALVRGQDGIRSIQLARNTVVTHLFPLEGNEEARGLWLLELPKQRAAVRRALETKKTVVAGPVDLVQGGIAFISRTPIYLTPPGHPVASGPYWGLATIVIDRNALFQQGGLLDQAGDLGFALRGKDASGDLGEVFWGDIETFESNPIVMGVSLPNGSWQLAAAPLTGWSGLSSRLIVYRISGALFVIMVSTLMFLATLYQTQLREREKRLKQAKDELEHRVDERTAALRAGQAELEKLAGELLATQEAERRSLARELHDDLSQRLAALSMDLAAFDGQQDLPLASVRDQLSDVRTKIAQLASDVHDMARHLHPSIIDDLGLVKALRSECNSFSQREGIEVTFEHRHVPQSLPKDLTLSLYRIAQEGLRNVARHSRSRDATLELLAINGEISLAIKDHGVGFSTVDVQGKGLGLISMRERARLNDGVVTVHSIPGKGTTIEARMPLRGEPK